jgi:hypothetical protein
VKTLCLQLCLILSLCLTLGSALEGAVRGNEAKYIGGTLSALTENTPGKIDFLEKEFTFTTKSGVRVNIPYDKVESLEYGQKAGRRLGVALVVNPLFLLSKKRKHFLTISFQDAAAKKQGAVFELAKGIVKPVLSTLETKTGKKIEYESEEAKKQVQAR